MTHEETKEIEILLGRLCDIVDKLEGQLRVYDSAFHLFRENNEKHASLLDESLALAETQPAVENPASDEHGELRQESLAIVSSVLQAIRNLHLTSE